MGWKYRVILSLIRYKRSEYGTKIQYLYQFGHGKELVNHSLPEGQMSFRRGIFPGKLHRWRLSGAQWPDATEAPGNVLILISYAAPDIAL